MTAAFAPADWTDQLNAWRFNLSLELSHPDLKDSTRAIGGAILDWRDLLGLLERMEDLTIAMHDAINRPQGVVPASGEPFYDAELAMLRAREA